MKTASVGLLVALLLAPATTEARTRKKVEALTSAVGDTLHVGKTVLSIEIADDESERVQGLSRRVSMGWDQGMLFSFPDAARRSFWMIDCHFDLDIAYISPDGTIRDIQAMAIQPGAAPEQLRRYPSASADIMYALEVNRGWFAARGVRVGDRLPGILRHPTRR
jgi:uncharacterized membrane protein (UPF0127 family)